MSLYTCTPIEPQPVTRDQAERRRRNMLQRRADDLPLLEVAGVAEQFEPVGSVEQIQAELEAGNEAYWQRINERRRQMLAWAEGLRARIAEVITVEQMAEWDRSLLYYPQQPEYIADFWRGVAKLVGVRP